MSLVQMPCSETAPECPVKKDSVYQSIQDPGQIIGHYLLDAEECSKDPVLETAQCKQTDRNYNFYTGLRSSTELGTVVAGSLPLLGKDF